jgi:dTMP kinase
LTLRRFITFEGIEGSGKTTQIQMLSNYLEEHGVEHLLTREPGGTPIGDQIRKLVLHPANKAMSPHCELFLYSAARAEHITHVIQPALREGRFVLCDRFKDATLAYQGYGRGLSLLLIRRLHALDLLALMPDLTLLFDIDPATALERARTRDRTKSIDETRFEQEELSFHKRVRAGYLELSREEPERFIVLNAEGGPDEVHHRVVTAVRRFL